MSSLVVKEFFDKETWTLTYVVHHPQTKDCVVIDPVWDYDPAGSKLTTTSIEILDQYLKEHSLAPRYILETHAHADHVSGAQLLKKIYPSAKIAIGENIRKVQSVFGKLFHLGLDFKTDGSQFDLLLNERQPLEVGKITVQTLFTPGHTPACSTYLIDDMAFVGDAMFMPDYGTGRCDFPEGSATELYHSIHEKIYNLPDTTRIFTGHDYQPNGRPLEFVSTLAQQKENNIQLKASTTESEFIRFRTERDKKLAAPRLLLPSVQININAGKLNAPESNGMSYLKIPILGGQQ